MGILLDLKNMPASRTIIHQRLQNNVSEAKFFIPKYTLVLSMSKIKNDLEGTFKKREESINETFDKREDSLNHQFKSKQK